jgi:hypothetical protein
MTPRDRLGGAWRWLVALACVAASVGATACGDRVDAKEALVVTDVVSGWFDAGIVGGKNKLVPSISFRVENKAASTIHSVQFNAVFRVIGDAEELGSAFVRGISAEGLAPGAKTEPFTLRSALGYTGEQPRSQMLQHSEFRDAQVQIFAKHGSKQWVQIGEFKVDRQLLIR